MNALDYLLKANLYGLLFAGSYWLLLRRHTFFRLNRVFLLGSAILSLMLPLVSLPTQTVEALPVSIPVGVITLPATTVSIMPVETVAVATQPDWEKTCLLVYGLIALALAARFSIRIWRLFRLVHQSSQQKYEHYVLVQPNDPAIPTFSFFQYVILNPADISNDLIIQHELVHVRQGHSADVIIMGILQVVLWACPTLWLIDRLLRQVHEFLADKPACQPTEYARFLVDYSFGTHAHLGDSNTLTKSFFNPSLLKQRIIMLHQKATNRWALGKYALILPLAFGLLAMTTARDEIEAIVSQATDETITVSGQVTNKDGKPLPGASVIIANTGKGTPTDVHGRYTLQNVPKNAQLSISYVGFTMQVVRIDGQSVINAHLVPTDPNELPMMGATAVYKAIKPNLSMPVRTPPSSERINGTVYTAVEEPAVFPTGIPGLMQYVAHTLRYPPKARMAGVQGNVLVEFMVLPTGVIGAAKIKKGIGSGCDEEALRIVRQIPKWIPAQQNGKPVAAQFVLPIQFALEKKEDKRTGKITPVSRPDSNPEPANIIDNSKNAHYTLFGDLKDKPLFLLNGKTELSSLEAIDPRDIERTEFLMTSKAQVLYGPKAADGVVIIYLKGAWEQDPKVVRQTFLDIIGNPAKETEYYVDRKQVTENEVEKLRIENIRAIDWQKGDRPERRFDIVDIYTR